MQLEQLQLIACGPFTDCKITLHPGMNVLYGPNEAGKSSALRAVRSLLFGFDHKTTDDFVHSYQQLRAGGVLVDSKGNRLECVRRKGRTTTLRDGADEKPVDAALLQAMLGGVSEDFFLTVFGIDHARLREGGDDVVRGQGQIGELLFAAGGVAHLREKQHALEEAANSLYKPAGRNPRINAALSQVKQLNDDIRGLQRSPEEWAQYNEDLRLATELELSLKSRHAEAEAKKARLVRIYSAIGLLASWKQKESELAALAHVVSLSADVEDRYKSAREREILAANAEKQANKETELLQARLDAVHVPVGLIEKAIEIDSLYRRLGSHEKAVADRAVLEGQRRTARDSAKRSIEKLGWDLKLDDVAPRRLPDDQKARVRALAHKHGEVSQRCTSQQQAVESLRRRLEACTTAYAGMPSLAPTPALKESLAAAAVFMETYRRFDERRRGVAQLQDAANDAAARLPLCDGSLEQIRLLKVPSVETTDVFDESRREIEGTVKQLQKQRAVCQTNAQSVRQELEALELAESVPTEEDLQAARAVRDRGVRLAVQALNGQEIDPTASSAFVKDVAEGDDVASALEPSVRNSDALVDRLRRESGRVAKKSTLLAQLHALENEVDALDREITAADARQARWQAEWNQAWQDASIVPATPNEMRAWLRNHARLLALAEQLGAEAALLAADEKSSNALSSGLSAELLACGIQPPQGAPFDSLLTLAKARVAEVDARQEERRRLEADKSRLEAEVADAIRDAEVAQAELVAWKQEWSAALVPLQLDADAVPEQAEAVLANLDELFRSLDGANGYKSRMFGIDETAKEFAEAAEKLCAAIAPDLSAAPVEQIAATLNARLASAKELLQQRKSLEEQLLAEQWKLSAAESDLGASRALLQALLQEAECESLADLPAAITNAAAKARLQASMQDIESQLLPFCAGKTLDEFNADAESEDADRLESAIGDLQAEIDALREQRDEAIKSVVNLTGKLQQFAGAAAAAEKADERQFLLRQLEDDTREYAVAAVASRLLRLAVERYREKSQGPVLAVASKYFAKLTRDAFKALRSDYDDAGQEALVGVRQNGMTLPVEAMSEGTRDQLYLALRLGTLEHWFERHEPIPFIVDDVLLAFDDERASAAIEALLELSKKTQVLLFTHHSHVATLARDVAASAGEGAQYKILTDWNRSVSA